MKQLDSVEYHPTEKEPAMVQAAELGDKLPQLSNQELRDIIIHCETAISEGSANVEDFEAFVLCQQELTRRTWG